MSTKNQTRMPVSVKDARANLPSSNDVRKGVNVLSTSDPENPAPNPFVQSHNSNVKQGTERTPTNGQVKSKGSD
jgi:hypothetical protein